MSTNFERRGVRIALLLLLAVVACNDAEPPQEFLWSETFEDVCEGGFPCDWERISGDANDARYVESSFLSGEHALLLTGDARVRGPGAEAGSANFMFGSLEVRAIGRCDEGAGIDILVGLAEVNAGDAAPGRVDMTMPATLFLPETWARGSASILITSEGAFSDGGAGLGPPLTSGLLRVTSVVLAMNGPGSCEIAEVLIDDAGMTRRFLEDGC